MRKMNDEQRALLRAHWSGLEAERYWHDLYLVGVVWRSHRVEAGLSQLHVATMARMSDTQYARYERCSVIPSVDNLPRVLAAVDAISTITRHDWIDPAKNRGSGRPVY